MPTVNQLVRQGRKQPKKKSSAPALKNSPQKEGFVPECGLSLLKSLIRLYVKWPG